MAKFRQRLRKKYMIDLKSVIFETKKNDYIRKKIMKYEENYNFCNTIIYLWIGSVIYWLKLIENGKKGEIISKNIIS